MGVCAEQQVMLEFLETSSVAVKVQVTVQIEDPW